MTLTTVNHTQPANNGANTAAIVAWGSALSGLFSAAGLVTTSDTGQVNWGTASPTYPVSGIGEFAYEVWRLNDALQATKPVFLRVGYCYRFSSPPVFFISLTVGTSTSGAGAITGVLSVTALYLTSTSAGSPFSGTMPAFSSGDGSSLVLVTAPTTTISPTTNGGAGTFYMDRTRDAVGAPTGEGLVLGTSGHGNSTITSIGGSATTNSGNHVVLSFTTSSVLGIGGNATSAGVVLPSVCNLSMSSGTTVGFDAPNVVCNQKILPPILAAIAYRTGDVAGLTPITLDVSGAPHTYLPLEGFCSNADRLPGNTSVSLAVRYE